MILEVQGRIPGGRDQKHVPETPGGILKPGNTDLKAREGVGKDETQYS